MAEARIPLIETVDLKKYFKVGRQVLSSCSRWYQHESVSWGDYRRGW